MKTDANALRHWNDVAYSEVYSLQLPPSYQREPEAAPNSQDRTVSVQNGELPNFAQITSRA